MAGIYGVFEIHAVPLALNNQERGIHHPQWVNLPRVLRMIVSFRETGR